MADNLSFIKSMEENVARIDNPNNIVGRGGLIPSNAADSGSRKLMQSVQCEHIYPLFNSEAPYLMTGRENMYAKFSSAYEEAESDYQVVAKINKYSFQTSGFGEHYFLILYNIDKQMFEVVERLSYDYVVESYGFIFNNEFLDSLNEGDYIAKGERLKMTTAYDEAGNRADGRNILTMYISDEDTKEDAMKVSDDLQDLYASPEIKPVRMMINDNDIPVNYYGDDDFYQCIPNIGEKTKNGILCALRKELKDQSLSNQSVKRLQTILMSDEKFLAEGEVIDINISSNNPKILSDNHHNAQLLFYYQEGQRFAKELVDKLKPLKEQGYKFSPQLKKLYTINEMKVNGKQYEDDKVFSNTILEVVVLNRNRLNTGDKLANRHGGKGCISTIVPRDQMPKLPDGRHVQIVVNTSGVPNRENVGQTFELSINMYTNQMIEYMRENKIPARDCITMLIDFLDIVAPLMSSKYKDVLDIMDYNESFDTSDTHKYNEAVRESQLEELVDDIKKSLAIYICQEPITETMTLLKIEEILNTFPFLRQYRVQMPMEDSNGNLRFVPSRRELTVGYEYFYRMKQYASEKFSATSLASVNMKNLPSRNANKKNFKSLHASTAITFGAMESSDMLHLGVEELITNFLLNSASPHGRRLTEQLLTGDPYDPDIKLDDTVSNRNVEIFRAYLLTMGLEIKFIKKPRKLANPITFEEITFDDDNKPRLKPTNLREVVMFDIPDVPMIGYVEKVVQNSNMHITFEDITFDD